MDPHRSPCLSQLTDVVGLYLDPPDKAIVLCVDEKSQIQVLFAALDLLDGRVIGQCHARHRHQEFLSFLRRLDREFPRELDLHLILDNYRTHGHPVMRAWLVKHTRFVLHFLPAGSSLAGPHRALVPRVHRQAPSARGLPERADLIAAIDGFLAVYNEERRPFVWTASADALIAKVSRCRAILETVP